MSHSTRPTCDGRVRVEVANSSLKGTCWDTRNVPGRTKQITQLKLFLSNVHKCTGTAAAATASSCFEVRCSFQTVLKCLNMDNLFDNTRTLALHVRKCPLEHLPCMVEERKLMPVCAIDAKVVCSLKSNTSAIQFGDLWG